MPQFESTYFLSQIFWLILSFGALYLGVQFIVFPLLDGIFKTRQDRIEVKLKNAEKLTQETQKLEDKIECHCQSFEKKTIERISAVRQQQEQEFQKAITQTENHLLKVFQKKIQTLENEEKKVLTRSDDFVLKAMKGKS